MVRWDEAFICQHFRVTIEDIFVSAIFFEVVVESRQVLLLLG